MSEHIHSDLVAFLRRGVDGDPDVGLEPANEAMDEAADVIEALRGALERIAIYGCGMLNQPIAVNAPEEVWLARRLAEYERVARCALRGADPDAN